MLPSLVVNTPLSSGVAAEPSPVASHRIELDGPTRLPWLTAWTARGDLPCVRRGSVCRAAHPASSRPPASRTAAEKPAPEIGRDWSAQGFSLGSPRGKTAQSRCGFSPWDVLFAAFISENTSFRKACLPLRRTAEMSSRTESVARQQIMGLPISFRGRSLVDLRLSSTSGSGQPSLPPGANWSPRV